jgi:hypothetical protein
MTTTRTSNPIVPARSRRTFREAKEVSLAQALNLALIVSPRAQKTLERVARIGHGTIWTGRALVVAAVSSSLGTGLFVLGGLALLTHR